MSAMECQQTRKAVVAASNSDLLLQCDFPFIKEGLMIHLHCCSTCLQLALLPGPLSTARKGQSVQTGAFTSLRL